MTNPSDNLEDLKREESELVARLAEIRREKDTVIRERRAREEEERKQREREKEVTVTVLEYHESRLHVQFEERSDLRALFQPVRSYTRERWIGIPDWDEKYAPELEKLPNVTIEWQGDSQEKYLWHKNAPAWEVDVLPTWDVVCKAGPKEGYRGSLNRIPGATYDYAKREYTVPKIECWRIPEAFERTEDVVYSDAAKELIFGEIERRKTLDAIATSEDCSPEFLELLQTHLTRIVWNQRKQVEEPFWQFLMPFQRVHVEFAWSMGGRLLNGDDTGLGKTVEDIAVSELARLTRGPDERAHQTLCVVRAANIPNWTREIQKLTGETPLVVKSGKPSAQEMHTVLIDRVSYIVISHDTLGSKNYFKRPELREKHPDKGDEWLKLHREREWNEGFYPWTQLFQSSQPDKLTIDEAHKLKNKDTHRFKAARPLSFIERVTPMTASPVLNRSAEIWTLLHMAAPDRFDSFESFISRYTVDGQIPRDVERLHELIRPMFLRRRKKDVQPDLPPINRIQRYHDLSPEALENYQKVLYEGLYTELAHFDPKGKGGTEKAVMVILAQITRLLQICAADKVDYTADLAQDLADEDDERRILIFSRFKGSSLSIAQRLGQSAVSTVVRKEDTFDTMNAVQRDALFESVRDDPSVRFICTTEAAQEGHNLEFCDIVMFNDLFWGPEAHRQCEGRAYGRLSNPHPIDSYFVVADVDIERWLMELLEKKIEIIEEVVDGVEGSRDASGSVAMELISKIKDQMLRQAKRRAG